MFIRDYITFNLCPNLNLNLSSCEDLWIKLQQKVALLQLELFTGTLTRILIYSLYIFEHTLTGLNKTKEIYYVAGDININCLNYSTAPKVLLKNIFCMIYNQGSIPIVGATEDIFYTSQPRQAVFEDE